jgi:hypothetical protein
MLARMEDIRGRPTKERLVPFGLLPTLTGNLTRPVPKTRQKAHLVRTHHARQTLQGQTVSHEPRQHPFGTQLANTDTHGVSPPFSL